MIPQLGITTGFANCCLCFVGAYSLFWMNKHPYCYFLVVGLMGYGKKDSGDS